MIGRKEEIKELIDLYNSKGAQFVAIYYDKQSGKDFNIPGCKKLTKKG